jgi:hypothetical protein
MYDGVTHYTVPNPIDRYKLGSDDELKKNPDGSFTVYVQHDHPGADKEANWLPAPAGPFYFMLRNYALAARLSAPLRPRDRARGGGDDGFARRQRGGGRDHAQPPSGT